MLCLTKFMQTWSVDFAKGEGLDNLNKILPVLKPDLCQFDMKCTCVTSADLHKQAVRFHL